jgi:lysophospholipase L1-like esterase
MIERIAAWGMLGGFLLLFFGDRWYWAALAALPWCVGAIALVRLPPTRLADTLDLVQSSRVARMTLLVLGALLLAAAWLFGVGAAVLAAAVLAALALTTLLARGARTSFDLLSGIATTGVTLLVVAVVGELLVSRRSVGARWGSPDELAGWQDRYDRLATRGNVLGYRSPHEQVAKAPGTFRVVALGDSYTWGDRIPRTEDVWPARLEAALGAGDAAATVEVVNLGRRGFTTANEVELMSRLGWQLEPDAVLLQFLTNDAFPSRQDLGRLDFEDVFGTRRLLPLRFRAAKAGESALLAYLERSLNALAGEADYGSLYREGERGWEQLQEALRRLGDEAARRSVPAVVLLVPRFTPGSWTAASHVDRDIHARVAEVAVAAGLYVVDLMPVFGATGEPGESWWAAPYDGHPNEAAHALIADEVARFLESRGLVPSAGDARAPDRGAFER